MGKIMFKCPKCGAGMFKVPRTDLRLHDKITCEKCGFTDTYERMVGTATQKKIAEDEVRKAFKGLR